MKYFDLGATEENLARVEQLGESIASLEGAIANLHQREADISQSTTRLRSSSSTTVSGS